MKGRATQGMDSEQPAGYHHYDDDDDDDDGKCPNNPFVLLERKLVDWTPPSQLIRDIIRLPPNHLVNPTYDILSLKY